MLVVSRKKEQEIVIGIGNGIVVKILKINGDRVQLGVTAPTTVSVLRGELLDPKKQKQRKNGLERSAT